MTNPTNRCPRCGHESNRVARNLRLCSDARCLTVFLVQIGVAQPQWAFRLPARAATKPLDIRRRGGKVNV